MVRCCSDFRGFSIVHKTRHGAKTMTGTVSGPEDQGALKGTNLRGQTEPKRRFSLILADSRLFLENKAFGNADRRKPQETAENRRLAFVPLGSSP